LIRIGIIGKTNTGKTTFFNASTLLRTEASTYPFTTKRPNRGLPIFRRFAFAETSVFRFRLLNMSCVYPVEDQTKFSDKEGNVLPDAILVPFNATLSDVAGHAHSELAQAMIHGIDARPGVRLPADYIVRDKDVIKVVATSEPRSRRRD
jgi:ribosome-binding ATPase YchF (GTP1/OBG family)